MRTTLTLEPDVARRVESELRRTGKTLKAVINEALKAGLGMSKKADAAPAPYEIETFDMGIQPGFDIDRANQFYDELEVEAYLEKERRDRS
jgi:hypothetical protein